MNVLKLLTPFVHESHNASDLGMLIVGFEMIDFNVLLLNFLEWPGGPKRHRFWDPEEGQSYSLPRHEWAVARRLHALGHQEPRKTGRAGQQPQGSTRAERTTNRETTPPLLPHPRPQKQVQRGRWHLQSCTPVVSSYFILFIVLHVMWKRHHIQAIQSLDRMKTWLLNMEFGQMSHETHILEHTDFCFYLVVVQQLFWLWICGGKNNQQPYTQLQTCFLKVLTRGGIHPLATATQLFGHEWRGGVPVNWPHVWCFIKSSFEICLKREPELEMRVGIAQSFDRRKRVRWNEMDTVCYW